VIVLAAKLARKAGMRGLASVLARIAAALSPGSSSAFAEYCSDRMAARDFDAIAARCARVADMAKSSEALKEAASAWLARSSIEDDANPILLARLRPAFRERGAETASAFARGEDNAARDSFSLALELAGAPAAALPEWIASLETASRIGIAAPYARHVSEPPPAPMRKIVVSGMYWSGSGALYDYFREFEEIVPIEGELRLWKEGDFCLNALAATVGEPARFRHTLYDFISKALSGVAPISDWKDVLASRCALSAMRADRDGRYARACRRFAEEAMVAACSSPPDHAGFACAAARFSDSLARTWSKDAEPEGGSSIALLDNVVHLGAIGAIRLLGDTVALCSFRDPRSNFVARYRENPRFHRDAGRYIEYYRSTRESFERTLSYSPEISSMVRRVSFERFILFEKYRDGIASSCGLDPQRRRRGKFFRPDASRRNIANYEGFPDKEAIRRIERELGVYCVEAAKLTETQNG